MVTTASHSVLLATDWRCLSSHAALSGVRLWVHVEVGERERGWGGAGKKGDGRGGEGRGGERREGKEGGVHERAKGRERREGGRERGGRA